MMMAGKILAVDDTPASLRLLTEILSEEGYEVRSAINGEIALRSAFANPPELVLLDIRMPDMDGFEVCRRLKAVPETGDVPVIFVSAISDTDEKVQGFELGAVDFVTKPYQREELLARVRTHLEVTRLRNHLVELVDERTRELRESEKRLRASLIDSVSAIASTVELRAPYTAGHQHRVAMIAKAIASRLDLDENLVEGLYLASVVHDVGKIHIPAEILSKPGRLNDLEYNLIKVHPGAGYEILKSIDFPWPIAKIVLQHHERLDGSGYPDGLKGDAILQEAKILAVADVIEAMASHRPYRVALGLDLALGEIEKGSGRLYDPEVVKACLWLFREGGFRMPQ
ncbi:MAG: response regulator [Burkholderiales bacterium]|nr:response regulator [Burkholderiales bacterium]